MAEEPGAITVSPLRPGARHRFGVLYWIVAVSFFSGSIAYYLKHGDFDGDWWGVIGGGYIIFLFVVRRWLVLRRARQARQPADDS